MINNQNLAVLSEKVAHLESAVKNSDEASEISYDNTDSGLTGDDVQEAIDELAARDASDIPYSSGVSVKDMLDTKVIPNSELTYNANITNGETNSSVVRIGNMIKVSMASVGTSGNISANAALISNLPTDAYSFSTGAITLNRSGTIHEGVVYMNGTNLCTQFNINSGDVIYGSIIYIA